MFRLTTLLSVLVLVACSVSQLPAATIVDTQISPLNGRTYHLLEESSCTDAEAEAVALGGHLVTVNDADEDVWVWNAFSSNGSRHLWIGLNDAAEEGTFVWSSGEPVSYTNWAPDEPNNVNNEDYVLMGYGVVPLVHLWNDLTNSPTIPSAPIQGVVEIPEPSTLLLLSMGAVGLLVHASRRRKIAN